MQHSQHCQENFNLLEEPACIARTFREGGKKWKQFKPFTNILFYQKQLFLVQTTVLSLLRFLVYQNTAVFSTFCSFFRSSVHHRRDITMNTYHLG